MSGAIALYIEKNRIPDHPIHPAVRKALEIEGKSLHPSTMKMIPQSRTMSAKGQLLQELERTPEFLIQEVLDFLCSLKLRHSIQSNSPESFSFALHHLQQLGEIGSRQPEIDALELSRLSRSDLERRSGM